MLEKVWGTRLHVVHLWGYYRLHKYWPDIPHLISTVAGSPCNLTPELALPNIGITDYLRHTRKVITHILLVARLTITHNWLSQTTPASNAIIPIVHTNITFEWMFTSNLGNPRQANLDWYSWFNWYSIAYKPINSSITVNINTLLLLPTAIHSWKWKSIYNLYLILTQEIYLPWKPPVTLNAHPTK